VTLLLNGRAMSHLPAVALTAAPAPPTPLGPFADSLVAWTTWVTLMGFVGLTALALLTAGPPARRLGAGTLAAVTVRLSRVAVVLSILAVPAVLTDLAHDLSETGGYDYGAAWDSLYDGSAAGWLSGLELTLSLAAAALLIPVTIRGVAARRARSWLLAAGLAAGAAALGTTKFPADAPDGWGRAGAETVVWMAHLLGGAIWIGGLAGLLLLALPGAVPAGQRGGFWSPAIRRFSAIAMSCVGAIALSGLFLYWEHVDGPGQLLTTMYGRVLGVKILIFGSLLVLGIVNQFWLHPRIEALRAAGDSRPLRTILLRRFPVVVAAELLLGLTVLFVAPFLHGSARNQAYAVSVARHSTAAAALDAKLPPKQATASTWVWGTAETLAVIVVMAAGYRASGRLARRRSAGGGGTVTPLRPEDPVEA
jgi:putative copper export protein